MHINRRRQGNRNRNIQITGSDSIYSIFHCANNAREKIVSTYLTDAVHSLRICFSPCMPQLLTTHLFLHLRNSPCHTYAPLTKLESPKTGQSTRQTNLYLNRSRSAIFAVRAPSQFHIFEASLPVQRGQPLSTPYSQAVPVRHNTDTPMRAYYCLPIPTDLQYAAPGLLSGSGCEAVHVCIAYRMER
jgi:hypothetical protein